LIFLVGAGESRKRRRNARFKEAVFREVILLRVVIVSDTHIPKRAKRLPSALIRGLERADAILHAGDWVDEAVIEELEAYAPVYGVAGNCDPPELRRRLGERRIVRLGGYRIGLVHGEGRKGTTLERAIAAFAGEPLHLLVFGHTHLPYKGRHGSTLVFNPGSPTDRRRSPRFSYGVALLGKRGIRVRHVWFSSRE